MPTFNTTPAFAVFVLATLVLASNLVALWAYSGFVRAKTKTVVNAEDAARGAAVVPSDPPAVARILRAHSNAMAMAVPFFLVGLPFVWLGGSRTLATVLFGIFVVSRLLHSVAYVAEKQPFRTMAFVTGLLAFVAVLGDTVWLLVQTAG